MFHFINSQEMCSHRITENMLKKKMSAIINCYFLSPVPPQLQINVTKEIASGVTRTVKLNLQVFKDAEVSHLLCQMMITFQLNSFMGRYPSRSNSWILPHITIWVTIGS